MTQMPVVAEMTKKQRVCAALAGEPVDRVPVSLWGHDYLREWSPEDLVAATLEQYRAHDWDFIKFNPRASYFAEAWGNVYDRPTESGSARQLSSAVSSLAELATLSPVDPRGGVFGEHLRALRLLLDEVGDEVDVVHTIFSPLSVVAGLCGPAQQFLEYAADDPATSHHALAAATTTLAGYAEAALEAGASGIFFAPLAWASHDTCSEHFYREFGRPYDLQLLAGIREADFNILHVCRDHNMIDLLLDYPVAAVNWAVHGDGNPGLGALKERTGRAVMGGVDHARLHELPAAEVAAQALDALTAGPRGLLLTAGCSIPPATPEANRAAVAAAARGA